MSGNRLNSDLAEERNRTRRLGSSGILIVRDMVVTIRNINVAAFFKHCPHKVAILIFHAEVVKIVVPLSVSLSEDFCVIYSPLKLPRTGGSTARFH